MSLRWTKMRLTNFGQFQYLDVDLDGDTVTVLGPNGSGKTTIIEAVYYLTTGELRQDNKLAWLHDLDSGKKASRGTVEGWFKCGGKDGYIKRSLHSSSSALTYGKTKLSKVNDINAFMTSLTGVTKRTFDRYCCVAQGETAAIISDQPAIRADAFAELFGAHHCKKIYELLGKEEGRFQYADHSDLVEKAEQDFTSASAELARTTAELTRLQSAASQFDDRDRYQQVCIDFDVAKIQRSNKAALSIEIAAADADTINAIKEKTQAQATLQGLQAEAAERVTEFDNACHFITHAEKATFVKARIDAVTDEIKKAIVKSDSARETLSSLQEPEQTVDADVLQELHNQVAAAEKLVSEASNYDTSGEEVICPTCKQTIEDITQHLREANKFLSTARPKLVSMRQEYNAYMEARRDYELKHDRAKQELQSSIETMNTSSEELTKLQSDFTALGGIPDGSINEQQQIISSYQELQAKINIADLAINNWQEKIAAYQKTKAQAEQKLVQVLETLSKAPTEDEVDAAKEALQAIEQLADAIATNTGLKAGLTRQVETAKATKEAMQKTQERMEKVKDYRELLSSAREVVHRNNLPRVRASQYTERINQRLGYYLTQFDSPFSAQLLEDYDFDCVFPSGKVQKATRLSGGEKVRLSLAFRFAVNELFAKDLGLLILDEPTAYLDDTNIQALASIFDNLRATAKNANMQIVVVTHEAELRGHFDKVVALKGAAAE